LVTVVADAEIEFCPAQVDTFGNALAEPGIRRIHIDSIDVSLGPEPYFFLNVYDFLKPKVIWSPYEYLNIITVNMDIVSGFSVFPLVSGLDDIDSIMAANPYGAPGGTDSTDAILMHSDIFGNYSTADSATYQPRTMAHEIGHWLGLRHVYGDDYCGNDYCADTPKQYEGLSYVIPTFPYYTSCSGPDGEMFMNYMDFTYARYRKMFTTGQKERMQTVLANHPMRIALANSTKCNLPSAVVEDNKHFTFYCAPNPSSGRFEIHLPEIAGEVSVCIMDIAGKKVYSTEGSGKINVQCELENGIYMVNVRAKNFNETCKIVIKR
jgi:hypothetical protein